ncbi:unnamed protein product [Cunninghamella blakesleeana]
MEKDYTLLVSSTTTFSNDKQHLPIKHYNSRGSLYKRRLLLLRKRGGPSIPVVHRGSDTTAFKKISVPNQVEEGGEGANTITDTDNTKPITSTPSTTSKTATTENDIVPNNKAAIESLKKKKGKPKDEGAEEGAAEGAAEEEPSKKKNDGEDSEKESSNNDEVRIPIDAESGKAFQLWVTGYFTFVENIRLYASTHSKTKKLPEFAEKAIESLSDGIDELEKQLKFSLTSKKASSDTEEKEDSKGEAVEGSEGTSPTPDAIKLEAEENSKTKQDGESLISVEECVDFFIWVSHFEDFVTKLRLYGSKDNKKKRIPDLAERAIKGIIESIGTIEDQVNCNLHKDLDNITSSSD